MKVNLEWVKVSEGYPRIPEGEKEVLIFVAFTITDKKTGKVTKVVHPAQYKESNVYHNNAKEYVWDWYFDEIDAGCRIYNSNRKLISGEDGDKEVIVTHWMYQPEYPQERI